MCIRDSHKATRENIFVIGGGQIYDQALNDMDKLYITQVDAEFSQATVFFPRVDCLQWHEVKRDHHEADDKNKYPYDFVEYMRS